jgi:PAS domain S-box-containing protein
MLASKFPMFLYWGEDLRCFYNDAFRLSLGDDGKHPGALGMPGADFWPQVWPRIQAVIMGVSSGNEATWIEDQPLPVYRNGKLEDVYWTYSFSPVVDEGGKTAGVLVACNETTKQVVTRQKLSLSEQRFGNLIRQTTVGIIVLSGADMVVEIVNDAYGRLIDRRHEELIGKPLFTVIPEARPYFHPILEKVRTTGEPLYLYDYPYFVIVDGVKKEGFLDLVYQPFREQDGSISGVMVVCHDVSEKVLARRKVEESEEKYRSLFETMDQGFCLIEMLFDSSNKPVDYRFIELNPRFEQQTGLKKAQGKSIRELVPDIEAHWFEIYGKVALTGESIRFTEGSRAMGRWFDVYAFRLGGNGSRKVALLFTDITGRKQSEEALQESEARFRSLAQNSPDVITRHGKDHRYLYASPRIEQFTGIKAEDFTGKTYRELGMPEALCLLFDQQLESVFQKQALQTIEYTMPDGKSYIHSRMVPEFNESGEIVSALVLSTDISERKRAEEAMKESELRFRTMSEDSQILIALADETSHATYFSKTWVALTGRPMEDLLEFGWADLIHPDDRQPFLDIYLKAFEKKETFTGEFRILDKDGHYRWLWARGPARFRPDGSFAGYISSCIDITEHKQAAQALYNMSQELVAANEEIQSSNEELAATNRQLMHINADLDNFVYTASHDLKAPITNIEGLMKVLLKQLPSQSLDPPGIRRIVEMIQDSVERFKHTISSLMEVVKLGKEKGEPTTLVNLPDVVGNILLDLEPLIDSSGARITLDVAACAAIRFTEKNLRSVVYNLISNAIKYHSPDRVPQVDIVCKDWSEYQVLTVSDNGLGMEAGKLDQLFAMFKRFHTHVEGSGIGLYMVKKIVENAGGRIEVESQLGVGSTFRVYFKK